MKATLRGGWILSCLLAAIFCVESAARRVEFTVLHTTDLHGFIRPAYTYDGRTEVGGYLRVASRIRQLRRQIDHTLYIDCGDLTQGSIEAWLSEGEIIVRALEQLHCDAWVIGNHEFDWGTETLRSLMDRTQLPAIAANLTHWPGRAFPLPEVQPYLLFDVAGVRVAVVGLSTPGIPNWTRPTLLGDVRILPSVDALSKIIPRLRDQVDVLIVAAHQGYRHRGDDHANEINRIASAFPEIDLLLGGHTHRVMESETVHGTVYSQAGYHANWLGRVDIVYDTADDRILELSATVEEIGNRLPQDKLLQEALTEEIARADAFASEVIGSFSEDMAGMSPVPGHSDQQELICRAILEATDADFVLHGAFHRGVLPAGPVDRDVLWRLVPYENRMGLLQVTKADLKEILEENAGNTRSFRFMGNRGFTYTLHPDRPAGQRVEDLLLASGEPMHPHKRYSLALNSYILASGGMRFPNIRRIANRPILRLQWHDQQTREMVEAYIQKHSPVGVTGEKGLVVRRGGA